MDHRRMLIGLGFAGLMCGVSALAAPPKSAAASAVLPLNAKVEGLGYAELSAHWWRWTDRFPGGMEPYRDPDGRWCKIAQSGPVWFLAGTDGSENVQRRCSVPVDKHVFLPIINLYQRSRYPVPARLRPAHCKSLLDGLALSNDALRSAVVLIDGVRVADPTRYRVRTERCFDAFDDDDDSGAATVIAASDGYWLLLPPMKPGRHTLVVGANYGRGAEDDDGYGNMVQNFEYVLDVGGPTY